MNRGSEYRMHPGSLRQAQYLARICGARRYVWNWAIGILQDGWREYKAGQREEPPSFTFFSLGVEFTKLRASAGHEWLTELPHREVKFSALSPLAGAMTEAVRGKRGFPRRKHAEDRDDAFTIPTAPKIRDGKLWIPGVRGKQRGFWVAISRRGGDPHAHGAAKRATIRRRPCGRWIASVTWEVPDAELPDSDEAIGVDLNVRQVTASDGAKFDGPDLARLERKRRKHQRREQRRQRVPLLDRETGEVRRKKNGDIIYTNSKRRERARRARARIDGRLAYARRHYCHTTSAKLARKCSTVVVEDLQVRNMTKSARGTRGQPGRNVRAKRGLNRSILGTGWAALRVMLEYKVRRVVRVPPHHTSRQCSRCGFTAAGNRTSQAAFKCLSCGHQANADVNAAINILRRGLSLLRGDKPSEPDMEGGPGGGRAFSSA